MFTHVVGSFQVPKVSYPGDMPAGIEYGCSTWIGLDGQRSYRHTTLPQIGTGQFIDLGGVAGPTTTAWFQWWPLGPITFSRLEVNPNDVIMCWLSLVDLTHVLAVIRIKDSNRIRMLKMQAPMVIRVPQFPNPAQAQVSGATAEWVTERTTSVTTGQHDELPAYGTVVFDNCYAVSALGPDSAGRVEKLVGPKLIRMYRVDESLHRSVTISVAERLACDSIATTYRS